jgi:hypothetical protein
MRVCCWVGGLTLTLYACSDQCPTGTVRDGGYCRGVVTGSTAAGSGGVATDDTGRSTNPKTSAPPKPTMPSGTCASGSTPVVETCDNVDNDCDGKIDEDVQRSCGAAMIGLCHLGKQSCSAGAWGTCEGAVDPVAEVCDTAE